MVMGSGGKIGVGVGMCAGKRLVVLKDTPRKSVLLFMFIHAQHSFVHTALHPPNNSPPCGIRPP